MARNAAIVVALTVVALLPVFAPDFFTPDPGAGVARTVIGILLSLALPAGAVVVCWRTFPGANDARSKLPLILFFLVVAALLTEMHYLLVDRARYFPTMTNTEWQEVIVDASVRRDPTAIPHSYRFLPDSLTRLLHFLSGSFVYARTLYRWTFSFLLVFAIFRFASPYLDRSRALVVVLAYGLVYPVTILAYAGQLADPMSHLSFVLAFLALQSRAFVYLLLAIAVGCLAKESVVALLGYYLLFCRRSETRFWAKLGTAAAVCLLVLVAARFDVLRHGFSYADVSGVSLEHVKRNLSEYEVWGPLFVFSVGIFLPFVILGWRAAPREPKRLTLFLLPVLLVSNALFSWMHEVRNFVPAIVAMAVIAVNYLLPPAAETRGETGSAARSGTP